MKKIDSVFFLYLLLTTCLLLASWNASNNSKELFLVRVIIVFAVIGLIFINSKIQNPIVSFIRSTYPLILSGYFYAENVFFNKLIFDNIDSFLFKLESSLFGMQPSIEFSKSISEKWFSEFMYLGYFSFYLLIIGFALYIYFLNKEYFNKALFILCSSLYIFYLIFSFIPSAGPQFYFTSPESILPDAYIFDKIIPLSALENYNLESLRQALIEYLPFHPKYYPDDQLTDEPEKFFVSEKIREKILAIYHDEIPYSIEVVIEEFKERERGKDFISALIVVERESQKPIILGNKGATIKKLGNAARASIESFLMREVYLELRVKVSDNWRKDENALKRFGYNN